MEATQQPAGVVRGEHNKRTRRRPRERQHNNQPARFKDERVAQQEDDERQCNNQLVR
jgi:hypothetical protein